MEGEKNLVYDIKISSVVPGKITGENKTYELKGLDLAMKLHYLKGLYFFNNNHNNNTTNDEENITSFVNILDIKKAMFDCLIVYYKACGRIRVSSSKTEEQGPLIKLNDAGVRIVEARSSKTVEEWLALEGFLSLEDQLVYNDNGLGPDLPFSPLVCLQVTWFKCGGVSIGISWAHVLGDAFSAAEFMYTLGQYIQGSNNPKPNFITLQDLAQSEYPPSNSSREPVSVKRVDPVGSHWVLPSNSKMGVHTFHITSNQLDHLHLMVHGTNINDNSTSQCFEVITSIIWKSIAKIRKDLETNIVTICRPKSIEREQVVPHNGQVLSVVEVNFPVSNIDPLKLVHLVVEGTIDETGTVEELVKKETGEFDFFVYGANLTFVDLEKANIYGFEIKGKCPRFASYNIGGIGEKGVVMVLPSPKDEKNNKGDNGKLIVVQIPQDEIEPLKGELKEEWSIK